MIEASDELFSINTFAMSHDPLPLWSATDGLKKLSRLNNAARVVHPNKRFFHHMLRSLQSGAYKDHPLINFWGYDLQSLEDAHWSGSTRFGITRFNDSGHFVGCAASLPGIAAPQAAHAWMTNQWPNSTRDTVRVGPSGHCVLPADYNFFVDFKSMFSMVYFGINPNDLQPMRYLLKRLPYFLYRSCKCGDRSTQDLSSQESILG